MIYPNDSEVNISIVTQFVRVKFFKFQKTATFLFVLGLK